MDSRRSYTVARRIRSNAKSFGTSAGQTGSSLFGTNTGATSSLFGQISATGAFGWASASMMAVGTTVLFNPPNGQDTMMKSGVTTNINTKHQCITAMEEYEHKSLEELRMEDYSANQKSRQSGSTSTLGLFGQTPTTQANTGFVYGGGLGSGLQTSTTGIRTSSGFGGGSAFGVQTPLAGGSMFGGGASGTTGSTGGFGTSAGQTGSSLFGTNTGATSSLFGQTSATGAFGWASASMVAVGTTVLFNPLNGQDTTMKSGVTTNINTKHQCITAMKEYENKSLEELRMEDYRANRKSKQAGLTSTVGLFGQTPTTQANTGFVYGGGLGSGLQTSTTGNGTSSGFGDGSAFGVQTPLAGGSLFGGGASGTTGSTGGGLFGSVSGTGFGQTQNPGGFCFGTSAGQTGRRLFGTNTGAISSLFGQISATGAFGWASASMVAVGTTVLFNPPNGQDTMIESGVTMNINTKHQCITAMKEYENKSLEELRMEDYSANRKSKQAGSTSKLRLFGQTPTTQSNAGFVS